MEYQFSFSNHQEIIFINQKPVFQKIGALIETVIDTNWQSVSQIISDPDSSLHTEEPTVTEIENCIIEAATHPVIEYEFTKHKDKEAMIKLARHFQRSKEMMLSILEELVEESQFNYGKKLYNYLYCTDQQSRKDFFRELGNAQVLPLMQRIQKEYEAADAFPFLMETNDLMTIMFQELQYLCTNEYYVRKCACCRQFIWTRKMNQIYCTRKHKNTRKTCAQIGPVRKNNGQRTPAYQLYWERRTQLYNRRKNWQDRRNYLVWLDSIEPYREQAKCGFISGEEMQQIIDEVEQKIYK